MAMNNIYIVASPGRTGSHIILEMLTGPRGYPGGLANAYAVWLPLDQGEDIYYIENGESVVIHLHDLKLIDHLDPSNITAIVCLRHDMFAQMMSLAVASVANEWSGKEYSDKTIEPVVYDRAQFRVALHRAIKWQKEIDLSVYKKVVTIYYEDIIEQGAEFLAQELDLTYDKSRVGHVYRSSPYNYKDIILNWKELYQDYLKITNTTQD
jgi:hypothetical protein